MTLLEHAFKRLNWDVKSITIDGEKTNQLVFADDNHHV